MARPIVEDLVRHARIPALDRVVDQDDLARYLSAAIATVESKCGPLEVTSVHRARLRGGILMVPFVGVDTVTVVGPTGDPVPVNDTTSDFAAGLIGVHAHVPGRYTLTVTREQDAADALWLATLLIAAYLWDVRRGATSTNRPQVDDQQLEPDRIPPRAWVLMNPWLTPVVA